MEKTHEVHHLRNDCNSLSNISTNFDNMDQHCHSEIKKNTKSLLENVCNDFESIDIWTPKEDKLLSAKKIKKSGDLNEKNDTNKISNCLAAVGGLVCHKAVENNDLRKKLPSEDSLKSSQTPTLPSINSEQQNCKAISNSLTENRTNLLSMSEDESQKVRILSENFTNDKSLSSSLAELADAEIVQSSDNSVSIVITNPRMIKVLTSSSSSENCSAVLDTNYLSEKDNIAEIIASQSSVSETNLSHETIVNSKESLKDKSIPDSEEIRDHLYESPEKSKKEFSSSTPLLTKKGKKSFFYNASTNVGKNTKARRITGKMKSQWSRELDEFGHLVCPMPGCSQQYVTLANFTTHYKWCSGEKDFKHCPYCSSVIFSHNKSVLHHMEVEHPEKVEEYKANFPLTDDKFETSDGTFVTSEDENSGLYVEEISDRPVRQSKEKKFSTKENHLSPKKRLLKHKIKSINEKAIENIEEFKKCVRFDNIVSKINSVSEVAKTVEGLHKATDVKFTKQRRRRLILTGNIVAKHKYFEDPDECEEKSEDDLSSNINTKSRLVLNMERYKRYNEYLKLTRDWASERRTYSRSKHSDSSLDSSLIALQNELMDFQDIHQLDTDLECTRVSLSSELDNVPAEISSFESDMMSNEQASSSSIGIFSNKIAEKIESVINPMNVYNPVNESVSSKSVPFTVSGEQAIKERAIPCYSRANINNLSVKKVSETSPRKQAMRISQIITYGKQIPPNIVPINSNLDFDSLVKSSITQAKAAKKSGRKIENSNEFQIGQMEKRKHNKKYGIKQPGGLCNDVITLPKRKRGRPSKNDLKMRQDMLLKSAGVHEKSMGKNRDVSTQCSIHIRKRKHISTANKIAAKKRFANYCKFMSAKSKLRKAILKGNQCSTNLKVLHRIVCKAKANKKYMLEKKGISFLTKRFKESKLSKPIASIELPTEIPVKDCTVVNNSNIVKISESGPYSSSRVDNNFEIETSLKGNLKHISDIASESKNDISSTETIRSFEVNSMSRNITENSIPPEISIHQSPNLDSSTMDVSLTNTDVLMHGNEKVEDSEPHMPTVHIDILTDTSNLAESVTIETYSVPPKKQVNAECAQVINESLTVNSLQESKLQHETLSSATVDSTNVVECIGACTEVVNEEEIHLSEIMQDSSLQKMKRPRGRPKKHVPSQIDSTNMVEYIGACTEVVEEEIHLSQIMQDLSLQKVKRSRGRPKKHVPSQIDSTNVVECIEACSEVVNEEEIHLSQIMQDSSLQKVKRPRGRPKKHVPSQIESTCLKVIPPAQIDMTADTQQLKNSQLKADDDLSGRNRDTPSNNQPVRKSGRVTKRKIEKDYLPLEVIEKVTKKVEKLPSLTPPEGPRRRGRPRKYPLKSNTDADSKNDPPKSDFSSENSQFLSDSLSNAENSFRKCSRKGRPQKCVRYADINSGVDNSESLDLEVNSQIEMLSKSKQDDRENIEVNSQAVLLSPSLNCSCSSDRLILPPKKRKRIPDSKDSKTSDVLVTDCELCSSSNNVQNEEAIKRFLKSNELSDSSEEECMSNESTELTKNLRSSGSKGRRIVKYMRSSKKTLCEKNLLSKQSNLLNSFEDTVNIDTEYEVPSVRKKVLEQPKLSKHSYNAEKILPFKPFDRLKVMEKIPKIFCSPTLSRQRDLIPIQPSSESVSGSASEDIFPEYKPKKSMFKLLSGREYEESLPPLKTSSSIKIDKMSDDRCHWTKLKCFESVPVLDESNTFTFFTGGPISSSAFCPLNTDTQYIALATSEYLFDRHFYDCTSVEKGLIQIWNLGDLRGSKLQNQPLMELGITHEHGIVLEMAWCPHSVWQDPSKDYAADNLPRLGLLAVAFSDSYVRIYSIPHPKFIEKSKTTYPIYSCYPSVTLKPLYGDPASVTQKSSCTCLTWQKSDTCERLAGGYGNGMICVWLVNSSATILMNDETQKSITPYLVFQAHGSPVISVSFAPLNGCRWLVSSSFDKTLKFFDLMDTSIPFCTVRRGFAKNAHWASHFCGAFAGLHDGVTFKGSSFFKECGTEEFSVLNISSSVSSLCGSAVSELMNAFAFADMNGTVSVNFVKNLYQDQMKQPCFTSYIIFKTDVITTDELISCNETDILNTPDNEDVIFVITHVEDVVDILDVLITSVENEIFMETNLSIKDNFLENNKVNSEFDSSVLDTVKALCDSTVKSMDFNIQDHTNEFHEVDGELVKKADPSDERTCDQESQNTEPFSSTCTFNKESNSGNDSEPCLNERTSASNYMEERLNTTSNPIEYSEDICMQDEKTENIVSPGKKESADMKTNACDQLNTEFINSAHNSNSSLISSNSQLQKCAVEDSLIRNSTLSVLNCINLSESSPRSETCRPEMQPTIDEDERMANDISFNISANIQIKEQLVPVEEESMESDLEFESYAGSDIQDSDLNSDFSSDSMMSECSLTSNCSEGSSLPPTPDSFFPNEEFVPEETYSKNLESSFDPQNKEHVSIPSRSTLEQQSKSTLDVHLPEISSSVILDHSREEIPSTVITVVSSEDVSVLNEKDLFDTKTPSICSVEEDQTSNCVTLPATMIISNANSSTELHKSLISDVPNILEHIELSSDNKKHLHSEVDSPSIALKESNVLKLNCSENLANVTDESGNAKDSSGDIAEYTALHSTSENCHSHSVNDPSSLVSVENSVLVSDCSENVHDITKNSENIHNSSDHNISVCNDMSLESNDPQSDSVNDSSSSILKESESSILLTDCSENLQDEVNYVDLHDSLDIELKNSQSHAKYPGKQNTRAFLQSLRFSKTNFYNSLKAKDLCESCPNDIALEARKSGDNHQYKSLVAKYGLIYKDMDLSNTAVPTSNNTEESDSLVDHYNISSVNTIAWNPNFGCHFWLFTAGNAGIGRLSCLSEISMQENSSRATED